MRAIILAAGRGSRMNSLTSENPKCLLKIGGLSLLDRQLSALRDAGIKEIAIVTGYKNELLSNIGLIEFHNSRWAETNIVSSLICASNWLEKDSCVVSYSDIFYSKDAITTLIQSSSDIAITYDPNWQNLWEQRFDNPLSDAETFRLNNLSKIIEIGNKPKTINEIEGQYMGLLRFSPVGWAELIRIASNLSPYECDSIHMTGMLQKIVDAETIPVTAISYEGFWGEIDSPSDLILYSAKKYSQHS